MANTYTWTITRMDCYPTQDSYTDVVFAVYWTLYATDGTDTCGVNGVTEITLNPAEPYTPYAQLTQDQVTGWVQEALGPDGVAQYEGNVDGQLAALTAPPVVTPVLPWSNVP